ncbi:MAG: ribonuclease HII [Methanothrix sp.]|jgi:ribonuclease HII|nr:MAG: ribonuclease HII [Methanosaeta sp. SDB]MCP1392517.1 ribonuclease HII [Methanothrix harundinacea]MDD2637730.1 ribonuclease HII [Methanothrix sp.]MDI9399642.1 ribonuclease HII [Euryarchaeota archaeon]MDD3709225.1 ribonuclease HII [Methanothrix sp.]
MRLLGADEAGKGPVIGSMFVAGVVIEEDQLFDLAALGVKDSKLLAPARREYLASKIEKLVLDRYVLEVRPEVIDELRQLMTMNEIMVRSFSKVVEKLSADRAILDAADVNPGRFARRVKEVSGTEMDVVAEHRADKNHLVVAAASILAKVERDRSVREIEKSLGLKIGSGYSSDPATVLFLENWVEENGDLPPFARRSWKTAERLKARFI